MYAKAFRAFVQDKAKRYTDPVRHASVTEFKAGDCNSAEDADITVEFEAQTQNPQISPASTPESPPTLILRRSARSRHPPTVIRC